MDPQAATRDRRWSESSSTLLTSERLRDLYGVIPLTARPRGGAQLNQVYSTQQDGFSLNTLYNKMLNFMEGPVVMLIRDSYRAVFGAYLSDSIKETRRFYGSRSTFLFTWCPYFQHFPWTGSNEFFMSGESDYFAVGSGDGHFGLWLDGDLNRGLTQPCLTFGNPVLTPGQDFTVLDLEVWSFSEPLPGISPKRMSPAKRQGSRGEEDEDDEQDIGTSIFSSCRVTASLFR